MFCLSWLDCSRGQQLHHRHAVQYAVCTNKSSGTLIEGKRSSFLACWPDTIIAFALSQAFVIFACAVQIVPCMQYAAGVSTSAHRDTKTARRLYFSTVIERCCLEKMHQAFCSAPRSAPCVPSGQAPTRFRTLRCPCAAAAPETTQKDTKTASQNNDLKGLNKYSSRITQPKSQGASQAMLFATGLREEDLDKPQVTMLAIKHVTYQHLCHRSSSLVRATPRRVILSRLHQGWGDG